MLLGGGKNDGDYDVEILPRKVWPIDKAKQFLLNILSDTPMDKNEVMEAATMQGIKSETLRRAREELGVITNSKGNRSWWSLPADYIDDAAESEFE